MAQAEWSHAACDGLWLSTWFLRLPLTRLPAPSPRKRGEGTRGAGAAPSPFSPRAGRRCRQADEGQILARSLVALPRDHSVSLPCYTPRMVELVFYIWLLGATLVFVGVTMTGEASERGEPLWLMALGAAWPLVLAMFLLGMAATLVGWLLSQRS